MPLLKGKENIGHNIEVEEEHGKPKKQATAIALRTAGVPPKGGKDVVEPVSLDDKVALAKHAAGITRSQDNNKSQEAIRRMNEKTDREAQATHEAHLRTPAGERERQERNAAMLRSMRGEDAPVATRQLPVAPVDMPAGEHNEPELAPVPVGDTMDDEQRLKNINTTLSYLRKKYDACLQRGDRYGAQEKEKDIRNWLSEKTMVERRIAQVKDDHEEEGFEHAGHRTRPLKPYEDIKDDGKFTDAWWASLPMQRRVELAGQRDANLPWTKQSELTKKEIRAELRGGESYQAKYKPEPVDEEVLRRLNKGKDESVTRHVEPVPLDDAEIETIRAKPPVQPKQTQSFHMSQEEIKKAYTPKGEVRVRDEEKSQPVKPVPVTRVNPAPMAKLIPVSKRPAKDSVPEKLDIVESYRGHSIWKVKMSGGAIRYMPVPQGGGVAGVYGSPEEVKKEIDRVNSMYYKNAKDDGKLEREARRADIRDIKIIKQELEDGGKPEVIAKKYGYPVQFVKDVQSGKAKDDEVMPVAV